MFDEGTARGLLLNNLSVNQCMMISLDSYTLSAGLSLLKHEMNIKNEEYTKPMRINNNFLEEAKQEKAICEDLREFIRDVINKEGDNDVH